MDSFNFVSDLTRLFKQAGLHSWVLQVFVVILTTAILTLVLRRVFDRIQRGLDKTATIWDNSAFTALRPTLRALVWVVGTTFAVELVPRDADITVFDAVGPIRDVAIIAIIAWFLIRFIREAEQNLTRVRQEAGTPLDPTTVDAVTKLLRLSVLITTGTRYLADVGLQRLRRLGVRRCRRHCGGFCCEGPAL